MLGAQTSAVGYAELSTPAAGSGVTQRPITLAEVGA
jgi:hypothetical protein